MPYPARRSGDRYLEVGAGEPRAAARSGSLSTAVRVVQSIIRMAARITARTQLIHRYPDEVSAP